MSRIYKFRAWDEETETMYYSDQEYEDCFFGFHKGVVVGWLRQTEPQTRDELAYDYGKPIGVMQFTGLTDKNGKEIYEGDILWIEDNRFECGGKHRFVRWGVGCWMLEDTHIPQAIQLSGGGHPLEVIGNIHSKPELLKEPPNA